MKAKEENRGKEEELSKKKELLSEEELLEVAAGAVAGDYKTRCLASCRNEGKSAEECTQQCKGPRLLTVW